MQIFHHLGKCFIEDLVNIGAYAAGTNPEYDLAIAARPWIAEYLQQRIADASGLEDARKRLFELAERINKARKPAPRPAGTPGPAPAKR